MKQEYKLWIKQKWNENNIKMKLLASFFICGIIFSILAISHNTEKDELYYFCSVASAICFSVWFIILPISNNKKDKISFKISLYCFMLLITYTTIITWLYVYLGYFEFNVIIYAVLAISLVISIAFIIHIFMSLFNFFKKLFEEKIEAKFVTNNIKNTSHKILSAIKMITSFLVTITAFLTAIISLIKVIF